MGLRENPERQGTLPQHGRLALPPAGGPESPNRDAEEYEAQLQALRRAQGGDHEAFRWLVEANEQRVFRLVVRMLGCDRHTAADVTQDVFLRAYRALHTFDGRALFRTWLHTIAMNLCISEYRKRKALKRDRRTLSIDAPIRGSEELRIEPASRETAPQDRAHHKDIASAVRQAVEELPEDFRACVLLRDLQGMSYEEIAEVLDLAPGTVRSRIHRGRLILQRKLKEFTP